MIVRFYYTILLAAHGQNYQSLSCLNLIWFLACIIYCARTGQKGNFILNAIFGISNLGLKHMFLIVMPVSAMSLSFELLAFKFSTGSLGCTGHKSMLVVQFQITDFGIKHTFLVVLPTVSLFL